jgi:hypothetical protein
MVGRKLMSSATSPRPMVASTNMATTMRGVVVDGEAEREQRGSGLLEAVAGHCTPSAQ